MQSARATVELLLSPLTHYGAVAPLGESSSVAAAEQNKQLCGCELLLVWSLVQSPPTRCGVVAPSGGVIQA